MYLEKRSVHALVQCACFGLFSFSSGEVELTSEAAFDLCLFEAWSVFFELYSVLLTGPEEDPSSIPLGPESCPDPTGFPMLKTLSFRVQSGELPENSLSSSSLVAINIGSTSWSSSFSDKYFLCWQYL